MLNIEVVTADEHEVGVVHIPGELTATTANEFRGSVAGLMAPGKNIRNYVIDLSAVNFVDSAGIGALFSILKRIHMLHGEIKLAGARDNPKKVLKIIHSEKFFRSYDSPQEALASFGRTAH